MQILDPEGNRRHQVEGFLPPEDFLGQLKLGLAHAAFAREDWKEAGRWFEDILDAHPGSDAAPEALYWRGVARYKASGDPADLMETGAAFRTRYVNTPWAKKASVWG